MFKKTILLSSLASLALLALSEPSLAKKNKDRVARDFKQADLNGDKKLSPSEWMRRGNFQQLDRNGDGFLSLKEVRRLYEDHGDQNYTWPPHNMAQYLVEIDPSIEKDRVGSGELDFETSCGIARTKKCGIQHQLARGLVATGTGPTFPEGTTCPGIDDYWAMDYSSKRNVAAFHGGIDLPVAWGTPMRAVAQGSVVAIYKADQSKRGIEIVLRHSPDQTGLPIWTYSAYGHLDAMPDLQIGQKVKMGDIIGPTGNSGISGRGGGQSKSRRPAIHLAMFYSAVPHYSEVNATIVPLDGYWLDPMAFYRQKKPFNSTLVKALPDPEKDVLIPILFEDGTTEPQNTKIIWPYACVKN